MSDRFARGFSDLEAGTCPHASQSGRAACGHAQCGPRSSSGAQPVTPSFFVHLSVYKLFFFSLHFVVVTREPRTRSFLS